jgi:hypothetical protein
MANLSPACGQSTRSKFAALLFAASIGVGAFLLFQVQFIVGKQILPWFGGVPAVWTTCMLFFQVLLLGGYGYAHLLGSCRDPGRQRTIHLVAIVVAAVLLALRLGAWPSPITPSDAWKPGASDNPIVSILVLLLFNIGLPFLVLAATGPLLQNWFARRFPGRSPYRLYALSNLGSLLGLLTYPFLLEPALGLAGQGWVWFAGFVLFALVCGGCAITVGRTAPLPADPPTAQAQEAAPAPATGVSGGRRALWFGLSMMASVMLLATTNEISLEIGVIPFLWMLPLSLYLLTFIISFEYERWYRRALWVPIMLITVGASVLVGSVFYSVPILVPLIVYSATMFAVCMVCHGEVVRHKPDPKHLTSFYLLVAAGGAAGGVFTGILAPAVFPDLWEFRLALVAACVLTVVLRKRTGLPAAGPVPAAVVDTFARRFNRATLLAIPLFLSASVVHQAWQRFQDNVHIDRGFFGVIQVEAKVIEGKLRRQLVHGRIVHGFQYDDPQLARQTTSYYSPGSGPDLANRFHPRRTAGQPMRFGVVGLGAGVLATFGRQGDSMRFYEISQQVIDVAAGPNAIFTYLRDCLASVELALGDARIALEREPPQKFDVLVLDAFSFDSVPVHLLTVEAGRLYLRHLNEDGILLFNVTNRYLDLDPVVRGMARALGLEVVRIEGKSPGSRFYESQWMVLARKESLLALPEIRRRAVPPPSASRGVDLLWTDSYSNILQVMKL